MNFNTYQEWAASKCDTPVECSIMGLAGEVGEVVDYLKKHIYHGRPLDVHKLELELGDVLWYLADVAGQYGIPLERVARSNVSKMEARYPDGFTLEAAAARADEK